MRGVRRQVERRSRHRIQRESERIAGLLESYPTELAEAARVFRWSRIRRGRVGVMTSRIANTAQRARPSQLPGDSLRQILIRRDL